MILDSRLVRARSGAMPIAPHIVPAAVPSTTVSERVVRSAGQAAAQRADDDALDLPALPGHPGTPRAEPDTTSDLRPDTEPMPLRAQGARDRGRVLIVSASRIGSAIERTLVRAGLATRRLTTTAEALREMRPVTRAVVVAPPLELLQPETAINLLEAPARLVDAPMLVVLEEPTPTSEARSEREALVESGAERVFSWPRDGLRLALRLATDR